MGIHGGPKVLLRLEGLVLLGLALVAYHHVGLGWGWFAALFLVPDLSLLGYLAGARVGAIVYNTGHSTIGAAALTLVGLQLPEVLPFAAIWFAHIGFDRALGYGLKYASGFRDTHLGKVGRAGRQAA